MRVTMCYKFLRTLLYAFLYFIFYNIVFSYFFLLGNYALVMQKSSLIKNKITQIGTFSGAY